MERFKKDLVFLGVGVGLLILALGIIFYNPTGTSFTAQLLQMIVTASLFVGGLVAISGLFFVIPESWRIVRFRLVFEMWPPRNEDDKRVMKTAVMEELGCRAKLVKHACNHEELMRRTLKDHVSCGGAMTIGRTKELRKILRNLQNDLTWSHRDVKQGLKRFWRARGAAKAWFQVGERWSDHLPGGNFNPTPKSQSEAGIVN